jgi:hypothetical protein
MKERVTRASQDTKPFTSKKIAFTATGGDKNSMMFYNGA